MHFLVIVRGILQKISLSQMSTPSLFISILLADPIIKRAMMYEVDQFLSGYIVTAHAEVLTIFIV